MVATVSWETVGVFGAFVLAAVGMLGGVAVRVLASSQKDATRQVIKEEVAPVMERMDERISSLEEDNVEHKVFRARMEGIAEGHKQAREEEG